MLMVARAATWNFQWQVKGFVEAMPDVDQRTLLGRFVDGSDVEGIDLRASVANIQFLLSRGLNAPLAWLMVSI
ncbi:MAG TPA: hypothetical protein VMA73_15665 [Streptosporangiaceae bacterium]|nr:hypothetical protein [Streptosporangiaceae bacterium]